MSPFQTDNRIYKELCCRYPILVHNDYLQHHSNVTKVLHRLADLAKVEMLYYKYKPCQVFSSDNMRIVYDHNTG